MKKIKYLLLFMFLIMGSILSVKILSQKEIKKDADAYIKFYLHQDEAIFEETSFTKKEQKEIKKNLKEQQLAPFKEYFKGSGLTVTKKQWNTISQAYQKALAALDYQITVEEKKGDTAVIGFKCQQIQLKQLEETATSEALTVIEKKDITKLDRATEIFVSKLEKGLNDYVPSTKMVKVKILFHKTKDGWQPKGEKDFLKKIQSATITDLP